MNDTLYQGAKDIFLVKVRADFDSVMNQAQVSMAALRNCSIIGSSPMADALFTSVGSNTSEGMRVVWRHVGTTGVTNLGTRKAGGQYPETDFIRTYETAVYDPNQQTAGEVKIPEERDMKEANMYKDALNRGQKLSLKAEREVIYDPFEVFNIAFTAPSSYPNARFFARGNRGLDGNFTALGERLVSTQHARADGGATQSNAVTSGGLSLAFSETAFLAARQLGYTFKDDIGDDDPHLTGKVTVVAADTGTILNTAKQMNASEWETHTNENQINVYNGAIVSVKSHPVLLASKYAPTTITNPSQWFAVDEVAKDPETGSGLVRVEFVPQQMKVEREDSTDSIVFKLKQEYSYGFVEWRGLVGSKGDNAAYSS